MKKANMKQREIRFYSQKNLDVLCVSAEAERTYANLLEEDPEVASYEVGIALDSKRYNYVNPVGLRKLYFRTEWISDFRIQKKDGCVEIHELIRVEDLEKRAEMEKLEFSRRYWSLSQIKAWKLVLIEKGE